LSTLLSHLSLHDKTTNALIRNTNFWHSISAFFSKVIIHILIHTSTQSPWAIQLFQNHPHPSMIPPSMPWKILLTHKQSNFTSFTKVVNFPGCKFFLSLWPRNSLFKLISGQFSISVGFISIDSTNCGSKILQKNYVCVKHVQTISLSSFSKQYNNYLHWIRYNKQYGDDLKAYWRICISCVQIQYYFI
jgi:hypothetical protein